MTDDEEKVMELQSLAVDMVSKGFGGGGGDQLDFYKAAIIEALTNNDWADVRHYFLAAETLHGQGVRDRIYPTK